MNKYHITKRHYDVVLSTTLGGDFYPGRGLDMSEPDNPVTAPRVAFPMSEEEKRAMLDSQGDVIPPDDTIRLVTTYKSDEEMFEEAKTLYVHFKVSYGLSSMQAAYQKVSSERKIGKSVYLLLTRSGETFPLEPKRIDWGDLELAAENEATPELQRKQFIADYGSHYISEVGYGLRIAVRGTIRSLNQQDQETFSGALKAAFGSLTAGGEVSAGHKSTLEQHNVQIDSALTVGGIQPDRPLILTSFEEIRSFMKDLVSGTVTVSVGPINAVARSYWHTFSRISQPNLKDAFTQQDFSVPDAEFGVPAGTVVAWRPSLDFFNPNIGPAGELEAPEGWAICNGNGTPDLRNRFVMGVAEYQAINQRGGSPSHGHSGETAWPNQDTDIWQGSTRADHLHYRATGHTHTHNVTTSQSEHVPPYWALVYIMKL